MTRSITVIFAGAVLASAPLIDKALEATEPIARCSLAPFSGARADELYFVGTARADTMKAGAGAVTPSQYGGHWGHGRPREVYGQLVRVDVFSSEASSELASLRDSTIVVVPWDYDPGCEPTYWTRSAAFTDVGMEGFYSVQLRPREAWIGDTPVADAFFADLTPYPHGVFYRRGYRGTDALQSRPSLTAREYFSLYQLLPTPSELQNDVNAAVLRIRRWERANPELATRYPADQIIAGILRRADRRASARGAKSNEAMQLSRGSLPKNARP